MDQVADIARQHGPGMPKPVGNLQGSTSRKTTTFKRWCKKRFLGSCLVCEIDSVSTAQPPTSSPHDLFTSQPAQRCQGDHPLELQDTSRNQTFPGRPLSLPASWQSSYLTPAGREGRYRRRETDNVSPVFEVHGESSSRASSIQVSLTSVSSLSSIETVDVNLRRMENKASCQSLCSLESNSRFKFNSPEDFDQFRSDVRIGVGRNCYHAPIELEAKDIQPRTESATGRAPLTSSAKLHHREMHLDVPRSNLPSLSATPPIELPTFPTLAPYMQSLTTPRSTAHQPLSPLQFDERRAHRISIHPSPAVSPVVRSSVRVPGPALSAQLPSPMEGHLPTNDGSRPFSASARTRLPERETLQVNLAPPSFPAGYSRGLPAALRAGYDSRLAPETDNSLDKNQRRGSGTGRDGQKVYTWPFVNLSDELFLNSDLAENGSTNLGRGRPRYQEPRTPSMEIEGRQLDVVKPMLGNSQDHTNEVIRQAAPGSLSAPIERIYEMEAPLSEVNTARAVPTGRRPRSRALKDQIRLPTRPNLAELLSPPTISLGSSDRSRVSPSEFHWSRFGGVSYQDGADEHSQRYRDRRRELRKGRQPGEEQRGRKETTV